MVEEVKSWVKQNSTLIYFLVAQAIAVGGGAAWLIAYSVRLETRVETMETRGAAYTVDRMDRMKLDIAQLEKQIEKNQEQINRIVTIMTRELHISPSPKDK